MPNRVDDYDEATYDYIFGLGDEANLHVKTTGMFVRVCVRVLGNVMAGTSVIVAHVLASVLQFRHKIKSMKCCSTDGCMVRYNSSSMSRSRSNSTSAAICNYVCMQQFIAAMTTMMTAAAVASLILINVLGKHRNSH